ncbi:MAG TPA: RidA family protein [Acidimicrobiales bacterium]|nr:RidA family protein [Acidimicrobiales bacterium]
MTENPTQNLVVNPPEMAKAVGFSHAVVAGPGRTVYLAGQVSFDPESRVVGDTWVEQFDVAMGNLMTALAGAGGRPEHMVWMQIFTVDVPAYRAARAELGPIYQRHMGRHYPAMSLLGLSELADEGALLEITGIAVVPD